MTTSSKTTPESEALGAVVKAARRRKGWSVAQLAQRLELADPRGWGEWKVRNLEYGRLRHPPIRTLRALSLALDLDVEQLVWAPQPAGTATEQYSHLLNSVQTLPNMTLAAA